MHNTPRTTFGNVLLGEILLNPFPLFVAQSQHRRNFENSLLSQQQFGDRFLQQPKPDHFVIAAGEQHSVRDFVVRAGARLGMRIEWRGTGLNEQGVDTNSGRPVIKVDSRYFRPSEVDSLLGDASKARKILGWKPETTFHQLAEEMVDADHEIARREHRYSPSRLAHRCSP